MSGRIAWRPVAPEPKDNYVGDVRLRGVLEALFQLDNVQIGDDFLALDTDELGMLHAVARTHPDIEVRANFQHLIALVRDHGQILLTWERP